MYFLTNVFGDIMITGNAFPCGRFDTNNFTGADYYMITGLTTGPDPNRSPYFDNFNWRGDNIGRIGSTNTQGTSVTFNNNSTTTVLYCDFDYHYYDYHFGMYFSNRMTVSMNLTVGYVGTISNISGPTSIAPCVTSNVNYSIPAVGGANLKYTWTLPPGWTSPNPLSGSNLTSITVTPNASSGGQVTVQVCNTACNLCNTKSINVVRPIPDPVFTTTTKSYCLLTTSSAQFCVSAIPNVTTYNWSFPSGWTGSSSTSTPCVTVHFNGVVKSGDICCNGALTCGASSTTKCFSIKTENTIPTDDGIHWDPPTVQSTPTPAKKNVTVYLGSFYWNVYLYQIGPNGTYQGSLIKTNETSPDPYSYPVSVIMKNSDILTVSAYNKNSCNRSEGIGRGYKMVNGQLQPYELMRVTGIEENEQKEIDVFPNPASSTITVQIANKVLNASVTLYDVVGKKIKETVRMESDKTELNVSDLQNGVYYLQIENEGQIIRKEKIVITH